MIHGYFYPRPPRGGRPLRWLFPCQMLQFLSTPSARRATLHGVRQSGGIQFLSTPSARRATKVLREGVPSGQISIHALREEGDSSRWSSLSYPQDFYPRPPRGGRRHQAADIHHAGHISIHALREEGDVGTMAQKLYQTFISIHALREEGDAGAGDCIVDPA